MFFHDNICWVPLEMFQHEMRPKKKLFEHKAFRPKIEKSLEGPKNVNKIKQICVIIILAYFT